LVNAPGPVFSSDHFDDRRGLARSLLEFLFRLGALFIPSALKVSSGGAYVNRAHRAASGVQGV
jgi:hypothetical protein